MGCFFGCFRVKDRDRRHAHLISDAVSSKSRNKLADLLYRTAQHSSGSSLLNNGKSSSCMDAATPSLQFTPDKFNGDSDNRELKKEVKFLKSCGTLLETPAEIRKTSKNVEVSPHDADAVASNFHSWLPVMSCRKLHLGEQALQVPTPPSNLFEEFRKIPLHENLGSPKHDSRRAEKPKQSERSINMLTEISAPSNAENILPDASGNQIETTQYQNKYVRFECTEQSMSKTDSQSSQTQMLRPNCSPYPTPIQLTDQMQTPGTVYPTNLGNLAIGKNTRIRSQYVYPVLNKAENLAQWKAVKGDSKAHDLVDTGELLEQSDSMEHNEQEIPLSVDSSSSHWLEPVLPNDAGNQSASAVSNSRSHSVRSYDDDRPIIGTVATHWNDEQSQISPKWWDGTGIPNSKNWHREGNFVPPNDAGSRNSQGISSGRSHSGQCSDSDRPILGTVAAHWNEEQSQISPKWWDGNGIPNSTNKYKEDQKVSWHATPFEERLEKALSDERLLPQRKLIDLEESEESDTAASALSASDHTHSILVGHA